MRYIKFLFYRMIRELRRRLAGEPARVHTSAVKLIAKDGREYGEVTMYPNGIQVVMIMDAVNDDVCHTFARSIAPCHAERVLRDNLQRILDLRAAARRRGDEVPA